MQGLPFSDVFIAEVHITYIWVMVWSRSISTLSFMRFSTESQMDPRTTLYMSRSQQPQSQLVYIDSDSISMKTCFIYVQVTETENDREAGENYIIGSFMICTLHRTLFGCIYQGEYDGAV
jgi:hypothetical protein